MMLTVPYEWYTVMYLKTDPDQKPRLFTGIQTSPTGSIYRLSCNGVDTWHFEGEVSPEKDVLLKMLNDTE